MTEYIAADAPQVDVDGLAALVGIVFHVPPRTAEQAVRRELRALELAGRRGMTRTNLAASDVASVIEALALSRR